MKRSATFIILFIALPFLCFAQKAYETANYSGKLNGRSITLKLANGFAGGSEIHVGNTTYYANSGRAEANNTMMFQSKYVQNMDYFVLNNMQDSYGTLPPIITGKYYRGRKGVTVKFKLLK